MDVPGTVCKFLRNKGLWSYTHTIHTVSTGYPQIIHTSNPLFMRVFEGP